jgi:hypothetical protein
MSKEIQHLKKLRASQNEEKSFLNQKMAQLEFYISQER